MVMEESTCLSYYAEIPVAIIGNSVSNFRYFYLTLICNGLLSRAN
jgi:hypothetical protein